MTFFGKQNPLEALGASEPGALQSSYLRADESLVTWAAEFRSHLRVKSSATHVFLPEAPDTEEWLRWLNEGRAAPSDEVDEELKRAFQSYVDEWLDTGKGYHAESPDAETPTLRSLRRMPKDGKGRVAFEAGCVRLSSVLMDPCSNYDFEDSDFPRKWLQDARGPGPFDADSKSERLFTLFMLDLEGRDEVAKCRYRPCGTYFLLRSLARNFGMRTARQLSPKATWVNGTFCCRAHGSHLSSKASFTRNSQLVHERMLHCAGLSYNMWCSRTATWQKRRPLRQYIRDQVNRFIARDVRVRSRNKVCLNWVTRYWQDIECTAQELRESSGVDETKMRHGNTASH